MLSISSFPIWYIRYVFVYIQTNYVYETLWVASKKSSDIFDVAINRPGILKENWRLEQQRFQNYYK